jgi:hypothetical protein
MQELNRTRKEAAIYTWASLRVLSMRWSRLRKIACLYSIGTGKDAAQLRSAIEALRAAPDTNAPPEPPLPPSDAGDSGGAAATYPLLSPQQVLKKEESLGRGTHGRVHRARLTLQLAEGHAQQHYDVAVKLFFAAGDSDRIRAEAVAQIQQVCSSLAHCSGLVPVYGILENMDHCVGIVHPLVRIDCNSSSLLPVPLIERLASMLC